MFEVSLNLLLMSAIRESKNMFYSIRINYITNNKYYIVINVVIHDC